MTLDTRRLAITFTFLAAFCSLPVLSAAQNCQFEYGIMAGLDYEHVSEDEINLFSMGAGIDYTSCGECYHGYVASLDIVRLPETNVYTTSDLGETEFNIPIFGASLTTDPESYSITFRVAVYCTCAQNFIGQPVAQTTRQVPKCLVPFAGQKGFSRNRLVLYKLDGPNGQPDDVRNGFASWANQNGASGNGVSYSEGDTSTTSGVVVTVGDAATGGENYGKSDLTVSGGRVLGGSLVISNDTNLVWTGDGYRRITQHELGHFHGLDDYPNSPSKGSVMRNPITEQGASLADYVTQCDGLRAFQRENN